MQIQREARAFFHNKMCIRGEFFTPYKGTKIEKKEPFILFLHGGGQTRFAWENSAVAMSHLGFDCLTIDLRGHGDSDWDETGSYSLDSSVGDIAYILKEFRRDVFLVGASFGGYLSMLVTGEELHKVQRYIQAIILVDVAPTANPSGIQEIISFMQAHQEGFSSLEEAALVIQKYLPHRKPSQDVQGLQKNLRYRNNRWFWHWDPNFLNFVTLETGVKPFEQRLQNALGSIEQPILLVRGALSSIVDEIDVQKAKEIAPHMEYIDVKKATHMVVGDKNDIFLQVISTFLQKYK